jgi:hypothetical protein
MSDIAIFSIGSILFIFLTWATVMFLYLRFNQLYRRDEATAPGAEIVEEGNLELLTNPQAARIDRAD